MKISRTPDPSTPRRADSWRDMLAAGIRAGGRLPVRILLGLVWIYQRTVSPALVVLFPTCGCRFSPTCSHYAADAIRTHGAIAGITLAFLRLLKCTPLHPGGFDPVPPRRTPRCTRLARSAPVTHRL